MKKLLYFLAGVTLFSACKPELEEPTADFEYSIVRNGSKKVNPDTVFANEVVTFTNLGTGDNFVIYTGAEESNYYDQTVSYADGNKDTNMVSTKGVGYALLNSNNEYSKEYSYLYQGDYKMVYVATTVGDYGNETLQQTNDDHSVVVIDTLALMSEIQFKKPTALKNAIIKMENLDPAEGETVKIKAMLKHGTSTSGFNNAIFKFQAANATVTIDGKSVAKPKVSYQDTIDLSGGKTAIYRLEAPSGKVKLYEVSVGYYDRELSTGKELTSVKIGGLSYTADSLNKLALLYPSQNTDAEVAITKSSNSTMLIGDDVAPSSITVADLIGEDEISIISEVGDTNVYSYTIADVSLSFTDFYFVEATRFLSERDDVNEIIDIQLSSQYRIDSLFPMFDVSTYTDVYYGDDMTKLDNGNEAVDFTSAVDFTLINGLDTLEYTITVTQ